MMQHGGQSGSSDRASLTYITGCVSGSFGSNDRDGIRPEVVTFGNPSLPGELVIVLKSKIKE